MPERQHQHINPMTIPLNQQLMNPSVPLKAKVITDIKKNRIYITLPTTIVKKDLEKIYSDIRFGVADLKPGFDVITDLTYCTIGHLSAISTLRKIMAFLVSNKVGRVVRIVGNMNVILKHLIGMTARFHCYKPVYVITQEEAEEELNHPAKPDGIRFQINNRQMAYTINGEQHEGQVIDISTSGCAVHGPTAGLVAEMEIALTIPLCDKDATLKPRAFRARVVRMHNDMFAVQFTLDAEEKVRLYECLTLELNNNI